MKNVFLSLGIILLHQTGFTAQENTPVIVERGPHHRVIEHTYQVTLADGRVVSRKGQYTEVKSGMHYLEQGAWKDSVDRIELIDGGALASKGQHHVRFAANINDLWPIDLQMADGKRLQSRILGLSYYDTVTGMSVLIAE